MKIQIFLLTFIIPGVAFSEFLAIEHKVRQASYWDDYKSMAIKKKIKAAPPEILDYITKDNLNQGWSNRPQSKLATESFRAEIISALEEIPPHILNKINKKLVAIFTLSNLGGTGYTESVFDTKKNRVAGFVALDLDAIDKKANEWASWKEQSPFLQNQGIQIQAQIESEKNNSRKNAIQYILLHEFGHILSIGENTVAPFGVAVEQMLPISSYKFTSQSWDIKKHQFVSIFDHNFPDRKELRYYAPDGFKLPARKAISSYNKLKKTNFPTLYAATNPHDDFADSFASYVHSTIMKKPWHIEVIGGKSEKVSFGLCWEEARCKKKRKVLEDILQAL